MKNYIVKALKYFKDKEEKKERFVGDEFETTKERYEYLKEHNAVKLEKIIDEIVDSIVENEEVSKIIEEEINDAVDEVVDEIITKKRRKKNKK